MLSMAQNKPRSNTRLTASVKLRALASSASSMTALSPPRNRAG